MDESRMDRRRVGLVALGALAATPLAARAQGQSQPATNTAQFGRLHRADVVQSLEALGSTPVFSSEGLKKLIARLRQLDLIREDDQRTLDDLVDRLGSQPLPTISDYLRQLIEKLEPAATLMKAIVSIAMESVAWCLDTGDLPEREQRRVVLKDFYGAIQGAGAGAALGTVVGVVPIGLLAAIGALGGSVTSSLDAASDARSRIKK